jgi:hypothetical protein
MRGAIPPPLLPTSAPHGAYLSTGNVVMVWYLVMTLPFTLLHWFAFVRY